MADPSPRSSLAPPQKSGGGGLIAVGVLLLLGAAGGILWYVNRSPETPPPVQPTATATTSSAEPATTLDLPPIEIPDAAVDDTGPADTGPKVVGGGGGGGCPATCTGTPTEAVKQAAAARAGTAKQCYKTALEGNESLSGDVVISLKIGTNGETCAASIGNNTTGSSKLASCVRSKMIATYPQPKGGCVQLNVPVSFKPKN